MKIGLFGQFGSGNSGNDGSLEAMIALLRPTGAELVCFCPNPAGVEACHGIAAVPTGSPDNPSRAWRMADRLLLGLPRRIASILHPFRAVRGLDMLIVPGTGFLDDYRDSPSGWPFMIFRWCLAAKMAGAKMALVSIGAGPIRHRASRWLMKNAARMFDFRSYRDAASKAYLASIGLAVDGDPVFPDLAFRLATPPRLIRPQGVRLTVGVGVMAYSGWKRDAPDGDAIHGAYLDKLAAFIHWLAGQGHAVVLVTGDAEDAVAVEEMMERLRGEGAPEVLSSVTCRPTPTLQALMRQLARVDVFVGSRFHNIVCALKLEKPLVSLGYAAKNDVLMAQMGLDGLSQHIETFEPDRLMHQFTDALERRQLLSERIRQGLRAFEAQLCEQDRLLLAMIAPDRRVEPQDADASRRIA